MYFLGIFRPNSSKKICIFFQIIFVYPIPWACLDIYQWIVVNSWVNKLKETDINVRKTTKSILFLPVFGEKALKNWMSEKLM